MFEDRPRSRSNLTGYAATCRQKATTSMTWEKSGAIYANRLLPYVVLDEENKYPETATKKVGSITNKF